MKSNIKRRMFRKIDPYQILLTGAVVLALFTTLVVCQHFAYFPNSGERTVLEVIINIPLIYGLYRGSRIGALAGLSVSIAYTIVAIHSHGFTLGVLARLILPTSFWLLIIRAAFQLSSIRQSPVSE
jgi:hypothetical protein